mmetsp:Transcript_9718/g.20908  ORF Transcript_9718/g.20908 Transcript_9718/m.20908 type:complete len:123 (+) Transcript_9718:2-370(+)
MSYYFGQGVGKNMEKAEDILRVCAEQGDIMCRFRLAAMQGAAEYLYPGQVAEEDVDFSSSMENFRIAACAGHEKALYCLRVGLKEGRVTKEVFDETEQACRRAVDSMTSDARERAKKSQRNS